MVIQVFIILQLVVVLVFSLLLFCPDGSFAQTTTTTTSSSTSDETTPLLESTTSVSSVSSVVPTCAKLVEEENFYFPNDCVTKCNQQGGGGGFDRDRSRNVNGKMKCYCVGDTTPICTDAPSCADLSIYPGSAYENCFQNVCVGKGSTDVDVDNGGGGGGGDVNSPPQTSSEDDGGGGVVVVVTDDIEFANSPEAANKNQTHFKVSCSCDNGTTTQCGIDTILFSDLTYLPSCTAASDTTEGKMNTLNIQSQNDCTLYCTTGTRSTTTAPQQNTNNKNNNHGAFVGGVYEEITSSTNDNDNNNNKPSSSSSPLLYSCSCFDDSNWNTSIATSSTAATTAVACDDTKANYNDGSGLGSTNCYEQVGVNTDMDCPPKDTDPAAATGGIEGRMVSTTIVTASVAMIILMV